MARKAEFPLEDILSILVGRPLNENHICGIVRLVEFLYEEVVDPEQLDFVYDQARTDLLAQYPCLLLSVPHCSNCCPDENDLDEWLSRREQYHGKTMFVFETGHHLYAGNSADCS